VDEMGSLISALMLADIDALSALYEGVYGILSCRKNTIKIILQRTSSIRGIVRWGYFFPIAPLYPYSSTASDQKLVTELRSGIRRENQPYTAKCQADRRADKYTILISNSRMVKKISNVS